MSAVVLLSSPVAAQANPADPEILPGIPTSALPPDGMCRVWLKEVPVNRQPAATDCSSAIKTRPRDAILLIGGPGANAKSPARSPVNSLTRTPNEDLFNRRRLPPMLPSERAAAQLQQQQRMAAQGASGGQAAPSGGASATAKAPDAKAAVVVKPPE